MLQDIAWQKASGRVETSWRFFMRRGQLAIKSVKNGVKHLGWR